MDQRSNLAKKYHALLVNDDGYKSGGIRALYSALKLYDSVVAVAPLSQQSWKGKSITGHEHLIVEPVKFEEFKGYGVHGTPADCAQLGIYEFFEDKPDYVVSGINDGANVGLAHILSSGTVGAALEASLQGLPAFASSVWGLKKAYASTDLNLPEASKLFEIAAKITIRIIHAIMAKGFPAGVQVICINIPYDAKEDAEIIIAKPHTVAYGQLFSEIETGKYKNSGNSELTSSNEKYSDLFTLTLGKISVVPISIQLSSEEGQKALSDILNASIAS